MPLPPFGKRGLSKPKPINGTTAYDSDGEPLLNSNAGLDEIYSYAMSSLSIPFVRDVGNRFAAVGDTRALDLSAHLAWLTGCS